MAETSVNLSRSHWYKEKFLEMLKSVDQTTAGGERYAAGECSTKGCNRH